MDETKSFYTLHDTGSKMTLLQKPVAGEIRAEPPTCNPDGEMHVDTDVLMEDTSLQIRGLAESEFHDLTLVRITECVPTLEHSLQTP